MIPGSPKQLFISDDYQGDGTIDSMRTFGSRVKPELEARIRQEVQALFESAPERREHRGSEFALDNADDVVMHEVNIPVGDDGERYRVNMSLPTSRPPFEWIMEITADVNEAGYIKHYLVREDDIVLADRKVLTVIDEEEARVMLADLAAARAALAVQTTA